MVVTVWKENGGDGPADLGLLLETPPPKDPNFLAQAKVPIIGISKGPVTVLGLGGGVLFYLSRGSRMLFLRPRR